MGGGNLQKSQMARERNQAKASKGEGGGGGAVERDGLTIITGRGLGSSAEAVLGPSVRAMLREEMSPPIDATVMPGNDGRLRIDGDGLRQWLEARAK